MEKTSQKGACLRGVCTGRTLKHILMAGNHLELELAPLSMKTPTTKESGVGKRCTWRAGTGELKLTYGGEGREGFLTLPAYGACMGCTWDIARRYLHPTVMV